VRAGEASRTTLGEPFVSAFEAAPLETSLRRLGY
jgi:hypothetical protein